MRIFFSGTPSFAVPSLEAVNAHHDVVGVLTALDKPAGRGRNVKPSAVKRKAGELGLPVYQTVEIDNTFSNSVRDLQADALVVVASSIIFREEFLAIFSQGGVNVHPSLLPRHRGVSPIPAAILSGDRETGVTVQRLSKRVDSGLILAQKRLELNQTESASYLSGHLAGCASPLLLEVLDRIESGTCTGIIQDESEATYCGFLRREDGRLRWNDSALMIDRIIRAYDMGPVGYTCFRGRTLRILKAGVFSKTRSNRAAVPGTVLGFDEEHGILVQCGQGILYVAEMQLQYKKPVSWLAFSNGHPDLKGAILGES